MARDYEILGVGPVGLFCVENQKWPELIAKHNEYIDEAWKAAVQENENIYNGSLLSFSGVTQDSPGMVKVTGHFVEYKHFLAQRSKGGPDLGIKPVAVSGVVFLNIENDERVVFGRRSMTTQYPGSWELIPSGSIDKDCMNQDGTIDYTRKIMEEFLEETVLSETCVSRPRAFAFILDKRENVYNIGCELEINGVDVEGLHKVFTSSTREYQGRVALVPVADLRDFVASHKERIVPTSLAMIEAWWQWRGHSRSAEL